MQFQRQSAQEDIFMRKVLAPILALLIIAVVFVFCVILTSPRIDPSLRIIISYAAGSALSLCGLYYVIKSAVKRGVSEALINNAHLFAESHAKSTIPDEGCTHRQEGA
jgi:hypothetical protein